MNKNKYQFNAGDYVKLNNRTGRITYCMYPTNEMIDKTYRIGIEFDGFNRSICLDIDEQDIVLMFDSIGKYDFFRKQDMDEFMWKQRVLRCADEISKLIEEGRKYR